jgi:hypothetical protein
MVYIMARLGIGRSVTAEPDWLIALGGNREVTVWLRSGREVAGTIEGQIPANAREPTVFRIKKKPSPPTPEGKYVLVSVKDIEMIHFNDSEPEAAKPSQPPA